MKKIVISLALLSSMIFAQTNQTTSVNPFEEIQRMQQQMDKLFMQMEQNFFNDPMFKSMRMPVVETEPKVDILKKGNEYIVKTDIPGASKDAIKITTKDNILKIEANIKKEQKEEKQNFVKQERFVQSYSRVITLPKEADAQKLKTEYKDGVLTIKIPIKK